MSEREVVFAAMNISNGGQTATVHYGSIKPRPIKAVQFSGKNSRVVAQWIRDHSDVKAMARGRHVAVHKYESFNVNMKNTDWAVLDVESGEIAIYDDEQFHEVFTLTRKK